MKWNVLVDQLVKKTGLEKYIVHTFLLDYFECVDTYNHPEEIASADLEQITKLAEQLCSSKPMAYILQKTYFFDAFYYVDERVLIQRPDTEILVEKALKLSKGRVLDLCCGSGIIGLSIAKHTDCHVTLRDISPEALEVAEINRKKVLTPSARERVQLSQGDLLEGLTDRYDVIVSNPPYIPSDDVLHLGDAVKNYEPHLALDGKEDGLYFYKKIASLAPQYLTENGYILLEVGIGQAKDVAKYLEKEFKCITIIKDNHGVERVVCAQKR